MRQFSRLIQKCPLIAVKSWNRTSRGSSATTRSAVAFRPEEPSRTVTVAVPPLTAVTSPPASTVTTEPSLDAHENAAPAIALP